MPDDNARWNLVVSHETDTALRQFLASQGGGRKGDLSRFVEQAVRDRIFEETVRDIRAQNADLSPEYIEEIVDEAVEWARNK